VVGSLAGRLGVGRRVRVPWEEVAEVKSQVVLRRCAGELGLGRGDDRLRSYLERLPGANR
jgi:hypothetical protein